MMKKLVVIIFALVATIGAKAQLKSVGDVPADLKMSTMELYESDVQRAKKYTGGKVRNQQALQEAAYRINKMMASGRIVYGDPISVMAGRIADTLLVDYPDLRSELRFYTVKSPEVNAFATGQGMVFINAGLVAQAENEAQLAFIISHEIIHYYRSHTMEELVGKDGKKRDSDKEREDLGRFIKRHNRSREMENEADSLGVAMFYLKSPYAKDVTEGVFDVLQYSALPFDDVPFDTTYFNTPYYQLNGCWLDKTAEITSRDDYDDSRSTHPNILSRRRKMAQAFDGYYGGEEFVMTTSDEFMAIRDIARNECIRQELIAGEYSRAFYNAWLMDREQRAKGRPSEVTAEFLAQALYGVAMFKNHNGTNSVTGDYNKIEGESQQVYYAMRQMTNEQVTLAALHKIWNLHRQYPQNDAFAKMSSDLMDELHTTHRLTLSLFATKPPETTTTDTVAQQQEEKHLSKYERIKQKRQSQNNQSTYVYALTDLQMSDSLFNSEMREHFAAKAADTTIDSSASEGGMFIYSTSYWVVGTKNNRLKIDECQRGEQDLAEQVVKSGNRFGREVVDFSDRGLHQMETAEQYNDFVVLNEWVNEFWQNKGQFNLRRLTQPGMDSIIERYGASIVSVNALMNVEDIHSTSFTVAASIFFIAFMPVFVYDEIANSEQTAMVTMVIDAAKGRILSRNSYEAKMADNSALAGAMLYDSYSKAFKGKSASGAMGRHLSIMGGAQLAMPGYFPISKIATFTPWASVELALGGKTTVGVGWSHIGAFDEYNSETRRVWVQDNYWNGHYINQLVTDLDYSKAMTTWSLTFRSYSSGFALLGPNFGLGAHVVHFTNPSDGSSGGNSYGVHALAGSNFVLFERFIINIEARYGYTAGGIIIPSSHYGHENEYRCKTDALLHNAIQFRIGLGVLPF